MRTLPTIGLGAAAFGVLTPATLDGAVMALLDRALHAGIRYFDTSPLYGSGRSETLLGRAVAGGGADVIISTKVGHRLTAPFGDRPSPTARQLDFSADFVTHSLGESLARLGRETIDIVLLHDPDDALLDQALDEALPVLREWQDRGIIKAVGLGTNSAATALRALARADLDAVLLAGRYTLLDRSGGERLIPRCAGSGTRLIVGGVLNSGLLADLPSHETFDYVTAPADRLAMRDRLAAICAHHGVPLRAAALQFAGRVPGATTLLGPTTCEEFSDCLAMLALTIPETCWAALDAIGARSSTVPA